MIVDDEPGFTRMVKLTLEASGNYEVCEQNNPVLATQTARRLSPDIILMDVVMPEMDGGEVLSQLEADPVLKCIPVIFVTAAVRTGEVSDQGEMVGTAFFVPKPVTTQVLIRCIEENIAL